MGATEEIAKLVVMTSFKDIPEETIERTKEVVMDFIGAAFAGANTTVGQLTTKYVREMCTRPEAGVIAGGFKAIASYASFTNATLNHSAELEAVALQTAPNIHVIIAPCLALGQKYALSGREVLEGIIIGFELQGRVSLPLLEAASKRGGRTLGFGHLGSAAAASKMLKLDIDQTRDALGIAANHAGMLILHAGTMAHFLVKAAFDGVEAAELAKMGLTAHRDVLEAPQGFCSAYVGLGPAEYNAEAMTRDFGNPFLISSPGISIKKYPCCYRSHRALDALFDLVKEKHISYQDVESLEVDINQYDSFLLKYTDPKDGNEARFSLQHILGAALVGGEVWLDAFTDEAVASEKFREARKKIRVKLHPEWPAGRIGAHIPITVKLKNGTAYRREVLSPKELTRDSLLSRYRKLAKPFLSPQQIEQSVDLMLNLDKVDNVTELADIVCLTNNLKRGVVKRKGRK
jgi:2-methylcitrate dehydratase PrpD